MAKKRRMSRKELKQPDKVLSTMEKGVELANDYKRPIIIAIVVVVLAVGLFIFYRIRTKNNEIAASKLYQKGLRTYTAMIDPSVKGDGKAGEEGQAFATVGARAQAALKIFNRIVSKYEGYAVARAAHFYRGRCFYDLKKFGDAITAFKKVLSTKAGGGCGCGGGGSKGGSDALQALALENLGYAQAAKGRLDDALTTFAKLRGLDKGTRLDWAYYHDALIREKKGDLKGAIASYEKFWKGAQDPKAKTTGPNWGLSPVKDLSKKRAQYLKMKLESGDTAPRPRPRRVKPAMRPAPAMDAMDAVRPAPAMDAMDAMQPAGMPAAMPAPRPAMPAGMPAAMPAPRPAMPAAMPAPRPAMPAAMPAPRPAMPATMQP